MQATIKRIGNKTGSIADTNSSSNARLAGDLTHALRRSDSDPLTECSVGGVESSASCWRTESSFKRPSRQVASAIMLCHKRRMG